MRAILNTKCAGGRLEIGPGGVASADFSGEGPRQVGPAVTTPLAVEYESVLSRPGMLPPGFGPDEITGFPDWFVSVATRHRVHYLWRPRIPDPQDDLVLEAAMAATARYLITFNVRHFRDLASLGIVARWSRVTCDALRVTCEAPSPFP